MPPALGVGVLLPQQYDHPHPDKPRGDPSEEAAATTHTHTLLNCVLRGSQLPLEADATLAQTPALPPGALDNFHLGWGKSALVTE